LCLATSKAISIDLDAILVRTAIAGYRFRTADAFRGLSGKQSFMMHDDQRTGKNVKEFDEIDEWLPNSDWAERKED